MPDSILELIGNEPPPIKVVDVGAMDLGQPIYAPLVGLPGCTVIGFEPNPEECAKLQAQQSETRKFLPYFIGDGARRTFHWCRWAPTSSLYPPNRRLLDRFTDLPELVQEAAQTEVSTTRLDDLSELRGSDFVKIDVQGATLDVLRGGQETIAGAVVVECEVEFVPLYEGEPLFAEVDQEMRRLGFLLHRFSGLATRSFAPLRRKPEAGPASQLLWTDAIYVRSFLDFQSLSPDELLKLALVVERVYGSRDLALLALQVHDDKTGGDLWDRYVATLSKGPKVKPPLPPSAGSSSRS